MEHSIMAAEYALEYPGYTEQKTILFDKRDVEEEEIEALLDEFLLSGYCDPRIVIISQEQYKKVFRSLKKE